MRQRARSKANTQRGDLKLSTGEFLVTKTGVTCRLKKPLNKLSGHYDWGKISFGIATLKLMVSAPETRAFFTIMKMFNSAEHDMIEDGIGKIMSFDNPVSSVDKSAVLAEDIEKLLAWTPLLAGRCPDPGVSRDLMLLKEMPPRDLGNFVGRHLGLA